MHKTHLNFACAALSALLGICAGSVLFGGPTTQPAPGEAAILPPVTQPSALLLATQSADGIAATQPADLRAAADERHKNIDERWRQISDAQRNAQRTRWADAQIAQTFRPGALVSLSLNNGLLKVETTDLVTPIPVRVAVEGGTAVWMLSRPRIAAIGGAIGSPYFNLTRFDFDARDGELWQSRLLVNNSSLSLIAMNLYGNTNLVQANGVINLHVAEYMQLGQPQKIICAAQASSLMQLRAEHPEEFRMYVIPLLARFADPSFLQPGPTDVYSVFVEIPADQKVIQEVQQLIPQLDADDPADRDAASAKLSQLGGPAVLAILRLDDTTLSIEQKLRLKSFVANFRRLPSPDPAAQRHTLSFLIDCLEYEDPAVRIAAKSDLENQTRHSIDFDTSLMGNEAAKAADVLRKQLLTATQPAQQAAPAMQPAPQS